MQGCLHQADACTTHAAVAYSRAARCKHRAKEAQWPVRRGSYDNEGAGVALMGRRPYFTMYCITAHASDRNLVCTQVQLVRLETVYLL